MSYVVPMKALQKQFACSDAAEGLVLRNVSRRFDTAIALDDVSVHLPAGKFSVLLGPSGCGKSTLLRLIAGLDTPTSGSIQLAGRDVTALHRHSAICRWCSSPTRCFRI